MNTLSAKQIKLPSILDVYFERDRMHVALSDGRAIIIPLAWYPKLSLATKRQLENFELSPGGYGVSWPDLDEDLSVYGFLFPSVTSYPEKASRVRHKVKV